MYAIGRTRGESTRNVNTFTFTKNNRHMWRLDDTIMVIHTSTAQQNTAHLGTAHLGTAHLVAAHLGITVYPEVVMLTPQTRVQEPSARGATQTGRRT